MSDTHAALVAAGYLRQGCTVERVAARTGLTVLDVKLINARLLIADEADRARLAAATRRAP